MFWCTYPIQYLIFNLVIKGLIYGSCHHPETIQHPGISLFFNCVTLEIEFLVLNIRPSFKLDIKKAKKNHFFSQIFSSSSDMIMTGIPQARLIWFPLSSDTSFLMHSQSHKVLVLTSVAQPTAGYTLWPLLCSVMLSGCCPWSPLCADLTPHLGNTFWLPSMSSILPGCLSS